MSMERNRIDPLFLVALIAGATYYANHWLGLAGPLAVAWKGSGVALLALWARRGAEERVQRAIAAALALGAMGDVLLETNGMTVGAIAFLAGHVVASYVYLRSRTQPLWLAALIALAIAYIGWTLTDDAGVTVYALGLGAMTGSAAVSRFPIAATGAVLFAVSDLLIFARMGPLAASPLPGLLVWPTYFAGQALIAWGVVAGLRKAKA